VTEPLVYPIRKLLSKFEMFKNIPIDMSFMAAMMLLILLTTILTGAL